jgi:hypothetical protein
MPSPELESVALSRRILAPSLVLLFALVFPVSADETPKFREHADLAAVRMSHAQLAAVIAKLRAVVRRADVGVDLRQGFDDLQLYKRGSNAVTLSSDFSETAIRSAFQYADTVSYRFWVGSAGESSHAPIWSVVLNLEDSGREIHVDGDAREQVEAVVAVAKAGFAPLRTFGGSLNRFWGGLVLAAFATAVSAFGLVLSGWRKYLALLTQPAVLISLLLLPWHQWLPGAVLEPSDANWVTRNSSAITLLATVGAVAAVLIECIRAVVRSERRE